MASLIYDEHPGLGDVLSSRPERSQDQQRTTSTTRQQGQQISHSGLFGFGFGNHSPQTYIDAALALRPSPAVSRKLCQAYMDRVHPLVKILHGPTLVSFLLDGRPYLDYRNTDPVLDLLRASVSFLAIATLSNEQCQSDYDTEKSSLLATYRFACELALDRAGLIYTKDITVLQSFLLYLVSPGLCPSIMLC